MAAHFNWTQLIPGVTHETVHVASLAVTSAALILIAVYARIKLGQGEEAIIPSGRLSVRGIFEGLCDLIDALGEMVIGHGHEAYSTLFASIFLFILFNNLVGLLPGMTAPTDNINTTFALGLFSFVMYNLYGISANGFGYVKQFMGPIWWMVILMMPIELVSHFVRPFTLGLRLMGNIQGDHAVLSAFLDMAPYGVPIPFYMLGLFVGIVQAFVFTVLSMVYVSMATSHEH
jgi:F-type H+-transporting ATPase subunit a